MNVWSTLDVNYISPLSDLNNHLDKYKDDWLNIFFLSRERVIHNGGDMFVDDACNSVKERLDTKHTIVVSEEPSHRRERELERILTRFGSSVLGIDNSQVIHVFILSVEDFQEASFGIADSDVIFE